ncbi:glycosyltransferase [Amylibacter sp.]|nr:glycosyltransferase [Amylibacter sp.]
MNNNKLFSVLIPVYHKDDAKLFDKALSSIKNNSRPPSQIVIVIDGPISFALKRVLNSHQDKIVDVVKLEENKGIVEALNIGLLHCKNELVARCDADDINCTDRFAHQLNAFHSDTNLSVCGGQIIEQGTGSNLKKAVPTTDEKIKFFLKLRNPLNHMTVMFKKSDILELGGYPNIKYREDYALWCKVVASGKRIINLPSVLVIVSGGDAMYKRRGGPTHVIYEFRLQCLMYGSGCINLFEFLRNMFVRCVNMIMPSTLRGVIYKNILRQKIND